MKDVFYPFNRAELPWEIGKCAPDFAGRCAIRDANGWEIAEIPGLTLDQPDPRADFIARLICAAPYLLAACETYYDDPKRANMAIAYAIEKVRG